MNGTARLTTTDRLDLKLRWEDPDCPLCGGRERTTLLEAADPDPTGRGLWFAIAECRTCGLVLTSPRPNEDAIADFYPYEYAPHRAKKTKSASSRNWLRRQPCPEHRVLAPHGECRLLDFGCGSGAFLDQMNRHGWQVTGVDNSPAAVEMARQSTGVPAFLGSLPHSDLKPGSFDVITMWHSLEHLHRPLEVLQAARQLLAPGGKLLVAVPNIAGLPFRWFGPSWFGLDLPRHLIHFSPTTLRSMLEAARFSHVTIHQIRHDDWLRSSARLACSRPHPKRWHKLLIRKWPARAVSWIHYWLGQSDCMLATAMS